MIKLKNWCKSNIIFIIVCFISIISCFIIPFDKGYLQYFEGSGETLTCIFGILIIVAGLENIDFFHKVARSIVKKFKTTRSIIITLIFITYISALINANDMALLTFLPLSYIVLKYINQTQYLAFTFIMQNIASNLGGMISPIGNPQNIYLFSYYNIGLLEFLKIMLIPTLCAAILIVICCFFVKKTPVEYVDNYNHSINVPKLIVYGILFVLTFLVVSRVIPFYIVLPIIIITMLICDHKTFKMVDYTIPLTFVAFFIFSGNMSRIPAISNFMINYADNNTFLCAYLSCQLISNVPTSILLSKFTSNYVALLVSVNVASLGIIFSSLSGVIAMKCYSKYKPKDSNFGIWKYIGLDLLMNILLLVVVYPVSYFSILLW
ncbi:MAG: citrate transporter [Clostridiales bacterium]|nr:citrate transporter [Clostridiales bacterium]